MVAWNYLIWSDFPFVLKIRIDRITESHVAIAFIYTSHSQLGLPYKNFQN